ncbi:MAG: hypothetical protein LBG19_02210 [Prevotellaceae bacterium]|jgi:hypothetical protein|nr:hypothetical protein [Prevotellaceae bacterium]
MVAIFLLVPFAKENLRTQYSQVFFEEAFLKITSMLLGETDLDFQKSVFLTENAYCDNKLDENDFKFNITLYSSTCRGIMLSGNIDYAEKDIDIAMAQCAVFMFMTDSIPIIASDSTVLGSIPSHTTMTTLPDRKTGRTCSYPP